VSQWAPEVHHINGTYYLYYTVDNSNQSPYLDVAVASSPDMSSDSWTDHGSIAMPEPGSGSGTGRANIDLNVLVAFAKRPSARVSSGSVAKSRHVVWGSYNTGLYGAKLSPSSPLTLTAGTIPQLLIADQPTPIYPSGIANRTEASFHFKRGSWIYYIYSRGSCCAYAAAAVKGTEYVTEVCRASSPAGPFLDKAGRDCRDAGRGTGTVLLESHTQDSSGNWQVFGPGSVGVVVCLIFVLVEITRADTFCRIRHKGWC
jgi:arabinan endo-1,5-alpha-L-arabinosidase